MRLSQRVLAVGLLGIVALPLYAQSATDRLQRMSQAMHQLNYEGTFVYLHQGRLESMRIIHGVDEQGERERLISLSGPLREVIRNNDEVTCVLPDERSVQLDRRGIRNTLPVLLPDSLERLNHNYRIELGEADRVAGLPARRVHLMPRDGFRYARHYWVAEESGMLLRAELHDSDKRPVEQLMFSELSIHAQPPAAERFMAETEGNVIVLKSPVPDENGGPSHWVIDELPAGFALEVQRRRFSPAEEHRVEHRVYSDGLASVSVFIDRDSDTPFYPGLSSRGAISVYALRRDNHRIVVVGEVPSVTVRTIGEAVHHQSGGRP